LDIFFNTVRLVCNSGTPPSKIMCAVLHRGYSMLPQCTRPSRQITGKLLGVSVEIEAYRTRYDITKLSCRTTCLGSEIPKETFGYQLISMKYEIQYSVINIYKRESHQRAPWIIYASLRTPLSR
jgi:hypothetical protein